jgi:uncharacterized Zn-finger protein
METYTQVIKSESEQLIEIEESYIDENEDEDDDDQQQQHEDYTHPDTSEDDQPFNPEISAKVDFYRCATCDKSFAKRSQLVAHEHTHENLRIYECPRDGCRSAFNVIARLIRHMRNVHTAEDDEIGDVKEHAKSIRPAKKFEMKEKLPQGKVQCEICHKILSNARYLKEHMALQHLKTTKYVCKEKGCRKRFKILSLLEKHMRKHNGIGEDANFC